MAKPDPEVMSEMELIRERAREGSFTMRDLSDDLMKEGLWGSINRLTEQQFRVFRAGAISIVRHSIKTTPKLNNGNKEFMALSEGPKAEWLPWALMNRHQSRSAYALIASKHRELVKAKAILRKNHKARFNEDPEDFLG